MLKTLKKFKKLQRVKNKVNITINKFSQCKKKKLKAYTKIEKRKCLLEIIMGNKIESVVIKYSKSV